MTTDLDITKIKCTLCETSIGLMCFTHPGKMPDPETVKIALTAAGWFPDPDRPVCPSHDRAEQVGEDGLRNHRILAAQTTEVCATMLRDLEVKLDVEQIGTLADGFAMGFASVTVFAMALAPEERAAATARVTAAYDEHIKIALEAATSEQKRGN